MGFLGLFEAEVGETRAALKQGLLLSRKGGALARLGFLSALERELGKQAVRIAAPVHMDRLGYVLLNLGRALGVEQAVGEVLAQGKEDLALRLLERARDGRILLLDDAQHLTTALPWDLGALLSPRLALLREALLQGPCVVAYAADAAPRGARELPPPTVGEARDVVRLWNLANGNLERFNVLWAMERMGVLEEPSDPAPGTDSLARALWSHLRGEARTVIAGLSVHGRPLARAHLLQLLPRHSGAVHQLEEYGLIERVGEDVVVLPALREAALQDAWRRYSEEWVSAMVRLARETHDPTAVLEAHRLLLDVGRAKEAKGFALYGAEMLLEHARGASLVEDWSKAIEGYATVLELDQHHPLPATTRGYARHYLHFNRYRGKREGLDRTIDGYLQALRDWQENAKFWSRLVRAWVLAGQLPAALDALREAYRCVPPHPKRDAFLLEHSYERLVQRQQPLAALALWAEARALGHGKNTPPEGALASLQQGIEVSQLGLDRIPPVELGASVRLVLLERQGRYAAVVPGFRGQGVSPAQAVQELVNGVRAALPPGARLALEDVAPQQYEPRFQRLGRTVGPDAAPRVQRELEQWWADQGREGAAWLVHRIRDEFHPDLLLSVAQCLIMAGAAALPPVLEALASSPPPRTRVLLLALSDLPLESLSPPQNRMLQEALAQLQNSQDPDLRELAGEVRARTPVQDPAPARSA